MARVWLGPAASGWSETVDQLGGHAQERDAAAVWLLSGELQDARTLAEQARPDQMVIFATEATGSAWPALGVSFDEIVELDVTVEELSARIRAFEHDRRTQARSRILRLLAHDLNNPLTAIRLLSEMLAFEVPGAEAKQDLRDVLEASDVAAALVESLSSYAKLRTQDRQSATAVDVSGIVHEVARRPCMIGQLTVDGGRAAMLVRGDKTVLKHAIQDMLLNARRLGENQGGCRASITDDTEHVLLEVTCQVQRPSPHIGMLVHEYGATVLRDERVTVSPAGLAHAARAAEACGGTLTVHMDGSTVITRLRLPLVN